MNTKKVVFGLFLFGLVTIGFAQEKTRKQIREEKKIEKQKQTAILVDSKDFVFVARNASPQGFRTIDLTTNPNYVDVKTIPFGVSLGTKALLEML
jgi:hypothetical protein